MVGGVHNPDGFPLHTFGGMDGVQGEPFAVLVGIFVVNSLVFGEVGRFQGFEKPAEVLAQGFAGHFC